MSHRPQGGQSLKSRILLSVKGVFSKLRDRSPSPRPPQSASSTQKSVTPSATLPTTEPSDSTVPSDNSNPQDNPYVAIGALPITMPIPETRVQRAKAAESVAYEGLKLVLEGLSECSAMCPPLKTAVGALLTFIKIVDVCGSCKAYFHKSFIIYSCDQGVLTNKKDFEDLQQKLDAILLIVKKYHEVDDGLKALNHRIEQFSECVDSSACSYIIDSDTSNLPEQSLFN
jgi:hypothetical protein